MRSFHVSVQQPHLLCYRSGENAHLPQVNSAFRPPCCRVYGAAERLRFHDKFLIIVADENVKGKH
jgi:hypothetical protein